MHVQAAAEDSGQVRVGIPSDALLSEAYPQARCVALVEWATHAMLGANIGPYRAGEWEL